MKNMNHSWVKFFKNKIKVSLHAGLDRLGLARGIHGLCGGELPDTVTRGE